MYVYVHRTHSLTHTGNVNTHASFTLDNGRWDFFMRPGTVDLLEVERSSVEEGRLLRRPYDLQEFQLTPFFYG